MISQLRDKPIQGCGHPSQPINLFWVSRWVQIMDGSNLVGVNLNPSMSDHVPQNFPELTPKELRSVEMQFMFSKY